MNFNRVEIAGRLVADPELRHTKSGNPYLVFRVAYNEYYLKGGEWKSRAHFFNGICWINPERKVTTLSKGDRVFVDGQLEQYSYKDREGKERTAVRIKAFRIFKLDKALEGAQNPPVEVNEEIEEIFDE